MKTRSYHVTNLGSFAPRSAADINGYVTYHDSPRYRRATVAQLEAWSESRIAAVRNAALTELAERQLEDWRKI